MAAPDGIMLRGLEKVIIGGLLAVLAAVPWSFRQKISVQFASSYQATIDLRTTTERDDKRVARAFAAARAAVPAEATIDYGQGRLIRKSVVHVTGPSRDDALFTARRLSAATASAFNAEGPGSLDTYISAYVQPMPGETSITVVRAINVGAGIIALAALGFLIVGWRENRRLQPEAKLFEMPATLALVVLAVGMIPLAIKVIMQYLNP